MFISGDGTVPQSEGTRDIYTTAGEAVFVGDLADRFRFIGAVSDDKGCADCNGDGSPVIFAAGNRLSV